MASGTSGNNTFVEGIPIVDEEGNRNKYFNIGKGKIEDISPTQRMVFDTETGKLMCVVPEENKNIILDDRVFVEIDKDGFFLSQFRNTWKFSTQ